jgi:tetratricopeptide (TPR) repeat protein
VPLAACLIATATLAAYANSFHVPFVYDDVAFVRDNPGIRRLWPPFEVMFAGNGAPARPLPNYTFAINYALNGLSPAGFHCCNLLFHLVAAWTLFAIVRRTLSSGPLVRRYGDSATGIGLAVAVLWAVHPLQTQAVTYIYQRMELLMGFFFLLTLYAFRRGADSAKPGLAYFGSVVACACGMLSKEVTVVAPLVVLLYDRIFVATSWMALWRLRWKYYLALASTWFLLAFVVVSQRHCYVEFRAAPSSPMEHAVSQPEAILTYLRLTFWPNHQCLDYGPSVAVRIVEFLPAAIAVLALLATTASWLWRRPTIGFLGAWFFLILAPSSSAFPVADFAAEHRMYLPLAALSAASVFGGDLLISAIMRFLGAPARNMAVRRVAAIGLCASAAVALGARTWLRNEDYRTALSIWENAARERPMNARAHYNLAVALADRGRADGAVDQFQKAVQIKPDYAEAHERLAAAMLARGEIDIAVAHYRQAVGASVDDARARNGLGTALVSRGQVGEAIDHYRKALQVLPGYAAAHNNLGNALASRGQVDEAIDQYRKALQIQPDFSEAHFNLGNALVRRGRLGEAVAQYHSALDTRPEYADAHGGLGTALFRCGRVDEAIAEYEKALTIRPGDVNARRNLTSVASERARVANALAERRELIRARRCDSGLINDTAWMLATDPNESFRDGAAAVELAERATDPRDGSNPALLDTLAAAYAEAGRFPEAVRAADRAAQLAAEAGNGALAGRIRARLELYRSGKPYRQPPR